MNKRSRRARTSFILNIVAAVLCAASVAGWVALALEYPASWIPAVLFSATSVGSAVAAHHEFKMIRVYRASEQLEERLSGIYR